MTFVARPGASRPDLGHLKRAVDAAVAATHTPPTPAATSWPFTFPQQHLAPDDALRIWDVVRYVRRDHRRLYRQFLSQWTIYDFVVDYLREADNPTLADLVSELDKRAGQETTWLVDIPLLNLIPPRETVPLGKRAMLVRADATRRAGRRFGSYLEDVWAVKRNLGDELTPRNRWLQASGSREVDVDTRMTASLLLVEDGVEELAVNLAETRARLAVAMWCLLSPPRLAHDPRQPWPRVGGWTPAAHIEFGIQRKLYEPGHGFGRAQRRGNRITLHDIAYRLTRSENYLTAPFVAMDEARAGNQCALAILSAARSLYLAQQIPNELERTERVLHVWRAKEALSDRGRRGQGSNEQRWQRLVMNLRLRSELAQRGYNHEEIDEALALVESLRHLATHRSEDVLVNLNYPEQLKTQLKTETLDADKLALALVAADWPVLLATVRVAARRLAKGAIKNGWSESWFNRRFA